MAKSTAPGRGTSGRTGSQAGQSQRGDAEQGISQLLRRQDQSERHFEHALLAAGSGRSQAFGRTQDEAYSVLNASIGSSFAARRAGTTATKIVTIINAPATPASAFDNGKYIVRGGP